MSDAKEKAEIILIIIKKILKWIGLTILGVGILFFITYQYSEYQTKQEKKIEDKVSIKAFHPKEGPCEKDYPYQYIVFNDSGKTVEKVSFSVGIRRVGFSSDLNGYTSIDEDKIIPSGEGYGRCFRATKDGDYTKELKESNVEIFIKYKDVTFKEK
jgi:hypothetical protein